MQANYHTYKRIKAADPDGPMGGYTRVLHAARPDSLMHFLPTLRVRPLPKAVLQEYPPMMRPWALCQFLSRVKIPEEYIFMTEPDHLFVRAPPLDAQAGRALVFPFGYAQCAVSKFAEQCSRREFNERGVPPDQVPGVRHTRLSTCSPELAWCCLQHNRCPKRLPTLLCCSVVYTWPLHAHAAAWPCCKRQRHARICMLHASKRSC